MSICRVDRPCMRGVQHWESEIERAMWQRGSDTVSPRQVPIIPQGSLLGNTGCLAGQLPCAEVWTQFSRLSSVTCRIKVLNTRAAALWTLFLLMGFLTPRQPHWVSLVAQTVQKSACNTGDLGSIPGSGEHPGEGKGNPLQDCGLVNSTDRGAWWATVHVVRKSGTWLHLPQVASLPFGDTLRAFYLPWWLEATRAFLALWALKVDTCSPWIFSRCSRACWCSFWTSRPLESIRFIHPKNPGQQSPLRICSNRVCVGLCQLCAVVWLCLLVRMVQTQIWSCPRDEDESLPYNFSPLPPPHMSWRLWSQRVCSFLAGTRRVLVQMQLVSLTWPWGPTAQIPTIILLCSGLGGCSSLWAKFRPVAGTRWHFLFRLEKPCLNWQSTCVYQSLRLENGCEFTLTNLEGKDSLSHPESFPDARTPGHISL